MSNFSQLNDYQHRALATSAVRQKGRAGKVWAGLEFASEALEVASLIVSNVTKSQFRPKGKKNEDFVEKIKDELGDMLWTVAVLAGQFDLQLGDLAESNLQKVGQKHCDLGGDNERRKDVPVVEGTGQVSTVPKKPKNPFPWIKGAKKSIKNCPTCGTETIFSEGCVSCPAPDCGWSGCS